MVLQQPDNEASNKSRRERAKAKKQRRRDRAKEEDKKDRDGNAGSSQVSAKPPTVR